jgi:hypothetical protein
MSETEPEGVGRPKPQVIDLEAEDIRAEVVEDNAATSPTETPEVVAGDVHRAEAAPPPPPAPANRKRGIAAWIIAALVAGTIAGAWVYRDLLSRYFPTAQVTAMETKLAALEARTKTIGDQMQAVSQAADDARTTAASANGAAETNAVGLSETGKRLDGIDSRIAKTETALAAARSDLDGLNSKLAGLGTSIGTTDTGAIDSSALAVLNQRIDALEKDVADLKASSGSGDKTALSIALSQALADLKAKVAAGASFQPEYDSISRMVPAAMGLDVLAAHAGRGLPAAAGLATELRGTIPTLPKPEAPQPSGGGYGDWLLESLSGIITIRTIGDTHWPELAEKAAALAESGELTQAIAAIDQAEGAKPVPLSQWRDRASARLSLEAAVGQVAEAVLRQIAAQGGAP